MSIRTMAGASCAVLLPLGLMAPAYANVQRFSDSVTDEFSVAGIRWVLVDNASASPEKLKVVTRVGTIPPAPDGGPPRQDLFIDTQPLNPGPEYRLTTLQDIGLYRVDGWHGAGRYVDSSCGGSAPFRGYTGSYPEVNGENNRVAVSIKRGCIGNPGKIRVAAHTSLPGRPLAHDWAQARKTFLPWVLR